LKELPTIQSDKIPNFQAFQAPRQAREIESDQKRMLRIAFEVKLNKKKEKMAKAGKSKDEIKEELENNPLVLSRFGWFDQSQTEFLEAKKKHDKNKAVLGRD
jgi:hypothetical protein